jgi:two-component system, sensor histidine kinase RegB
VLYSLGNLIENAVDFAATRVIISYAWNERDIFVSVTDDGPGFSATIITRLGEPYATERAAPDRTEDAGELAHGMGLGLFIAKTLLERSGASIMFYNATPEGLGARIRLQWPRTAFEKTSGDFTARERHFSLPTAAAASPLAAPLEKPT